MKLQLCIYFQFSEYHYICKTRMCCAVGSRVGGVVWEAGGTQMKSCNMCCDDCLNNNKDILKKKKK